jgi:hypothetical protein
MAETRGKSNPPPKREPSILERRKMCPARFYCNALHLTGASGPLCPSCDRVSRDLEMYSRVQRRFQPLDLLDGEDGPFFGQV